MINNEDELMNNIIYQDGYGGTTLVWAVDNKAPINIVALLIDKSGKDLLMMKDFDGETALHCACEKGASVEVLKYLLLNVAGGGELLVMKDFDGNTALDKANETDVSDEVKQILKDAITSAFREDRWTGPDRLNLPLLESFIDVHGVDGL